MHCTMLPILDQHCTMLPILDQHGTMLSILEFLMNFYFENKDDCRKIRKPLISVQQGKTMGNTTDTNSSSAHASGPANPGSLFLWYVAFGVVACVVILSNAVTLAAFRNPRLLRRSMYFLVNLSIADMTVGAAAMPMYMYLLHTSAGATVENAVTNEWEMFQNIHISIDIFTGMTSVFTLTAIAAERLIAVSCPIYYRTLRNPNYFAMLSATWLLSGVLSGTRLLAYTGVLPMQLFTYALVILSLASLGFILVAYVSLWTRLKVWSDAKRRIAGKKERGLVIAIAFVTIAFLITWLPFHIFNIIVNFNESLLRGIPYEVFYFAKLSHYSNSFMNPIIYSFKIPEFRRAVQGLFAKKERRSQRRGIRV